MWFGKSSRRTFSCIIGIFSFFTINYSFGHGEVIRIPCQWPDEDIKTQGEAILSDGSSNKLKDPTRNDKACSTKLAKQSFADSAGQHLIDLNSPRKKDDMDAYFPLDQKAVMAIIVRNEGYLRKRMKVPSIFQDPSVSLDIVCKSDIQYQIVVNNEFLARRLKNRCFQRHFNPLDLDSQTYSKVAQAHLVANTVLKNSIFTLRDFLLPSAIARNVRDAATQSSEVSTVDSLSQTESCEETVVAPSPPATHKSDDEAEIIISSRPREHNIILPPITLKFDDLSDSAIAYRLEYLDLHTYNWRRQDFRYFVNGDVGSEEFLDDEHLEEESGNSTFVDYDDEEYQERDQFVSNPSLESEESWDDEEAPKGETAATVEYYDEEAQEQDQIDQWSNLADNSSHDLTEETQESTEPPRGVVQLDSPEGMAQLMDIRSFLGMSPNTRPFDIWNFIIRNQDLVWFIENNALPIHREYRSACSGRKFERDLGLNTLFEFDDAKLELSYGFSLAWNSLVWAFDEAEEEERCRLASCALSSVRSCVGDGEGEGCSGWLRRVEWRGPDQHMLLKHHCRVSSPLRISLTRCDPKY